VRIPRPATIRASAWALLALARLRRGLRLHGMAARAAAPPGWATSGTTRAVERVLRATHATCLERSLVLQAWFAAHGIARDVVIGVTAPSSGFAAHAWLEGEPTQGGEWHELHRLSVTR
jgi:hypothetical protein